MSVGWVGPKKLSALVYIANNMLSMTGTNLFVRVTIAVSGDLRAAKYRYHRSLSAKPTWSHLHIGSKKFFTKIVQVIPMINQEASSVVSALAENGIVRHGAPL